MSDQQPPGNNNIYVSGTVSGQGFGIGQNAKIDIHESFNQVAGSGVDLEALKGSLTELYQLLGEARLPVGNKMKLQTLTGQAVALTEQEPPDTGALAEQIKHLGETFKLTGETIEEGSTLNPALLRLAGLVGPLVAGGARIVASWFGMHIPG